MSYSFPEMDSNIRSLHGMALDLIPGYDAHINKLINECNELAVSLNHFLEKKASPRDVEEEMADVLVLIHRCLMMPMFKAVRVDQWYEQKLVRLEDRLKR